MLYLKLMSNQDLPDSSPSHDFKIVQIADGEELDFFETQSGGDESPTVTTVYAVINGEGHRREIQLAGNAYVLNAQGKTIASRASY